MMVKPIYYSNSVDLQNWKIVLKEQAKDREGRTLFRQVTYYIRPSSCAL